MKPDTMKSAADTKQGADRWPAFKIEHNIPVPPVARAGVYKYPFRALAVGDSFFVPKAVAKTETLQSIAAYNRRALGTKYAVRSVDGGTRIWRIA